MRRARPRLDELLVERKLVADLRTARARIMLGEVLVGDRVETKPGLRLPVGAEVRMRGEARSCASRAGEKLARALDAFAIDVRDRVVLDAGASAGGFTDCLLQRGARKVFAVDVGHGQMDGRLANDPRVVNLERTNISDLRPESLGDEPPTLATVDLSYLSLQKAVPILRAVLPAAELVCLVKPLFEGVPPGSERDPASLREALGALLRALVASGARPAGLCASPILGSGRSVEFLLHLTAEGALGLDDAIEAALGEAVARHDLGGSIPT